MKRSESGTPPSPFLTVPEAARYLKVSEPTVWRWIRQGRLPSTKVGRLRRIPLAAIERLVNHGTPQSGGPGTGQFSLHDPLWALAGAGRSGRSDVSADKYRYLSGRSKRS